MSTPGIKLSALLSGVALVFFGASAEAHHFRGAALVPSVSATGVLSVTAASFWRLDPGVSYDIDDANAPGDQGNPLRVTGVGDMGKTSGPSTNRSDPRYDQATSTFTLQLPRSGLYEITGGGYFLLGRADDVRNVVADSIWNMNSSIFWDGNTASTPILFDLSNVRSTLVRDVAYNDNLDASSGAGLTLSYDQALNDFPDGLTAQPAGFTINPATGALNIPAASTTAANYPDNPDPVNVGADVAFSGNIYARDATGLRGRVEFEFMFDGVDAAANTQPTINDTIINALVGDILSTSVTASDDGLPNPPGTLSWTDLGLAPGTPKGTCSNAPTFSTTTGQFSWNTADCAAGPYIYRMSTSDSQFSDDGIITINLSSQPVIVEPEPGVPGPGVPEPATLSLLALGALGLAGLRRRRS